MTNDATKTRAIEYVNACRDEYRRAMIARDAIDNCVSQEWLRAHATAKTAAVSLRNAQLHAYEVKALVRPYWD